MAQNAIATAAVQVILSTQGITRQLQKDMAKVTGQIEGLLSDALKTGANSGGAALSSQLNAAANEAATRLQNELNGIDLPVSDMQNQMGQATEGLESDTRQSVKGGFVSGVKSAGPAILAAVAALGIGAVVAKGIGDAIGNEEIAKKTAAALTLSPEQEKKITQISKNLVMNGYGANLEEANVAITGVISSFPNMVNASSDAIDTLTRKALNMAGVFEVDVSRSVQVAGQMVKSGLSTDAVLAMDTLSTAMGQVPAALREDLVDAADEYGPFFEQMGYNGEEMMASLVTASKKGMYGIDKFGDAIKEFTLLASDPEKFEFLVNSALNYTAEEAMALQRAIVNGGDEAYAALLDLRERMSTGSKFQQKTLAIELFGTPLEDLNVGEVDDFLNNLTKRADGIGKTAEFAAKLDEKYASSMANTISSFKNTISITLADAMQPIVSDIQPQLAEVTKWVQENQGEVGKWIGNIWAEVGPRLEAMGAWLFDNKEEIGEWARDAYDAMVNIFVPAFEYVMPIVSDLADFINENKDAIRGWIPAIITVVAVLSGLGFITTLLAPLAGLVTFLWASVPAWWAAAAGATAFGIGILPLIGLGAAAFAAGLLIGTAAYMLVENWDSIMGWFAGISNGFMGWLGTVGEGFGDFLDGIRLGMDALGKWLANMGIGLANHLIDIANMVPNAFNKTLEGINGISAMVTGGVGLSIPLIPTMGKIPALATGAEILGPTIALVGEEDPEYVVNRGKMNNLIDTVTDDIRNSRGGDTITINNEFKLVRENGETDQEFAERIARVVAWKKRR